MVGNNADYLVRGDDDRKRGNDKYNNTESFVTPFPRSAPDFMAEKERIDACGEWHEKRHQKTDTPEKIGETEKLSGVEERVEYKLKREPEVPEVKYREIAEHGEIENRQKRLPSAGEVEREEVPDV